MLLSRRLFSGCFVNSWIKVPQRCSSSFRFNSRGEFPTPVPKVYNALQIASMKQRQAVADRKGQKTVSVDPQLREGSNEEVLDFEVQALLDSSLRKAGAESDVEAQVAEDTDGDVPLEERHSVGEGLPERFTEIELEVTELSSTGEGLALGPSGSIVFVVPFTLPGDRVLAKVVEYHRFKPHARTDFIKVIRPSPKRDDAGIGCKYFSTCSGCQLQMLPYRDQLTHKRLVVEKAFKSFSGLTPNLVPSIGETFGSPLEYNYRTKLTPHFDGPRGPKSQRKFTEVPPIGFAKKGRRQVMEIEDCPISTPLVREGLKRERINVANKIRTYRNGATILIRESTERTPKTSSAPYAIKGDSDHIHSDSESAPITPDPLTGQPTIRKEFPTYTEIKSYTSDNNSDSVEYIDDWKFTNRAGSFFQNNSSILSKFTAYVRGHALPPAPTLGEPSVKYLLDAYCGSGLFAITLSSLFKSTLGIDIDVQAVAAARANATANNIVNAGFIEADAAALFAGVPFPPAETVVVLDPPRKGCSPDFLRQLLRFGPKRVVYVSCNVHSQARDVGVLVQGRSIGEGGEGGTTTTTTAAASRYEIESLRGFDFFPQTGHVEGVVFLNRIG